MLINYLKISFRRLWTDKTSSAINILGLALGMTCCLVIFIFVRYELGFDSFHSNSERTFRIVEHSKKADGIQHWPTTAYPLAATIRENIPGVTVAQTVGPLARIISSTDSKGNVHRFEENRLMFADNQYLKTFDFSKLQHNGLWLAGNAETAFAQTNAVVLTQKLAERYFAEYKSDLQQIIGRKLMLNNTDPLVVSGIIRNPPGNTNLLFDMLVNYQFFKVNNTYRAGNWSGNYLGTTFVTLSNAIDPATFETQLATMKKKYMSKEDDNRISYLLQPLMEIHTEPLYEDFLGGYLVSRNMLWGLASLGIFLILIASFNFINLSTARALRRRKEVGVRKSVGSTQTQLFLQFVGETFIVTALAGILSLLAMGFLLNWLNHSLTIIHLDLRPDAYVWIFSAMLIVLVALLAGFYPAMVLSRFRPIQALKNTAAPERSRFSLRQGLIVGQFCITYGLLVSTFVASGQMNLFKTKELGFAKDAVLTINGPKNQVVSKMDAFRQQLLQNSSVREVSFSSGAPITKNYYGTNFRLKSEDQSMDRQAEMKVVDLHYNSLFDLKTLAGRWFNHGNLVPNGSAFNGFVVNETMIKMLGLTPGTAIGKTLTISEGEAPIIGVVKDFHNVSLQQTIAPCVFMCWNSDFYEQIHVAMNFTEGSWVQTGATLRNIEQAWKSIFPQDVYQYTFLDESLAKGYMVEQLVFDAFRIFAAISIFISCLGLFGLATFAAQQRTKEIGVRKVLGASVASIMSLLFSDFLKLVVIAILIASPIAWYAMETWLEDFAYRIDMQWWIFAGAGLLAVGIALLTVSIQSLKAALMNPVNSLKNE
ncbi:ABC transporter permease [Dyadobacter sp. CY261]|uniref:ABC transporter permease n=1 Tax=Dyadobacter sp. CY261 TaxID=2907203 RepID=UPI001F1CA20C|nr:ABC transporter permease [Dyadobacter sp. CY261]MCF0071171.1 ABC transporter permease [Dyadobacter sp. CY261]